MAIKLQPKPKYSETISCSIDQEGNLSNIIQAISKLKQEGVISTIHKIGNSERNRTILCPLMQSFFTKENQDINIEGVENTFAKCRVLNEKNKNIFNNERAMLSAVNSLF